MKKWVVLNKGEKEDIIKILLKNRGITEEKEIKEFLNPSLERLTPDQVKISESELLKAYKRIKKAISAKESIIVYTDYDADGVCSGAIVWETINAFGGSVLPYVPHRIDEGYGLSKKGIDRIKKEHNVSLMITVDHGITAWEKIDYAKGLGIDTIIVDHHLLPEKLPKTEALIHTTNLCATGIAWLFANFLIKQFSNTEIKNPFDKFWGLDLVALATIADLIPLLSANRTLVIHGLKHLNKTKRLGLKALIRESGIEDKNISNFEVGHILAPRINAMGRLTHAIEALRLICTLDPQRAEDLAKKLNQTNRDRQIQTEAATSHAVKIVRTEKFEKIIFIASENYQQGVIGLVAGRLVEEFHRPAIVISKGMDFSKASARSVNGCNIVELIAKSRELLVDLGGHPQACGFTVPTKNIEKLKTSLIKTANRQLLEKQLTEEIKIDLEMDLSAVNSDFFSAIQKLAPFGIGNPMPVFLSRNLEILRIVQVGKDKQHLKLQVRPNSHSSSSIYEVIGFGKGNLFEKFASTQKIDLVYTLDENVWNGTTRLQLKIKDVKLSD